MSQCAGCELEHGHLGDCPEIRAEMLALLRKFVLASDRATTTLDTYDEFATEGRALLAKIDAHE